jgi:8-oxo-dGTP diphosphatase
MCPSEVNRSKKPVPVTAAIWVENGKVMIARRNSQDRLAGKWEFPGGKVEENETPHECLRRELKEEFNIDVEVGDSLGVNIHHYPHISIELMAFRVYRTGGTITANEHAEYRWVPIAALSGFDFSPADIPFVKMLRRGDIELQSEFKTR